LSRPRFTPPSLRQPDNSAPSENVTLLSAPHVGKRLCDLPHASTVRFVERANHGPHKFAKVEVLERNCAGVVGYLAWSTLDPRPQ